MASLTWEAYVGTPSWSDMGSNRLVFSGSRTVITTTIASGSFQDGTHLGSGTPGTDQCGTNHGNNVKLLTASTMSVNGAGSQALNDSNLADNQCSFRLHFNDAAGYSLQNGRLYTYDGTVVSNPSVGVDAAVYIKYAAMTQWATINSNTITGPSIASMSFQAANIGGDNIGSYVALPNQTAATDHYYYAAISVSPETSGGKNLFALGAYLEYY